MKIDGRAGALRGPRSALREHQLQGCCGGYAAAGALRMSMSSTGPSGCAAPVTAAAPSRSESRVTRRRDRPTVTVTGRDRHGTASQSISNMMRYVQNERFTFEIDSENGPQ